MPIIPDILSGLPHVRPKIELVERYTNNVDGPTRAILEDIAKGIDQNWDNIFHVYVYLGFMLRPFQKMRITAADLSASDDPDDVSVPRSVLQTVSATPNEFDWRRAGGLRHWKVTLGIGDGVPSHDVIIDRDDKNLGIGKLVAIGDAAVMVTANVCRPYGTDPDNPRLQFGEWRSDTTPGQNRFVFWPSSIAVGTWVYLEQDLPMAEFG